LQVEILRGLLAVISAELLRDGPGDLKGVSARDLDRLLAQYRQIAVALDFFSMIALYIDVYIPVDFFVFIAFYD
jgi:hypothetical protein